MEFHTRRLGAVDIDETSVIVFPRGLPALENCTRFTLFHEAGKDAPHVYWMQSLDNPDVLFTITEPAQLGLSYEIELSDEETALLDIREPEEATVAVIVYQDAVDNPDPHPFPVTLRANARNPLVINLRARLALQKTAQTPQTGLPGMAR
ncbi:flagellar assembly protein FliW [Paludibacterium paludis]|uniref:Flagellar assembly factor FliW n=1 Tax=Paludibacterium paludis TaxID=1225769 RepID=A0A918NZE5_9NEIS|nr:flagellar assembly protein FliW [Paludibacterium paludis]GGY06917.1 hypothetical protein GCM10011289_06850 [Paludibacterium paludis]